MEIHSSSLRSSPTKLGIAQTNKLSNVQNNVTQQDAKPNHKQPKLEVAQGVEYGKDAQQQTKLSVYNGLMANDILNKPINTKIQQALNAYHDHRLQTFQNQPTESIVGVDLYV